MNKFILILFGGMCVAQWVVPGMMIYDSETVMAEGRVFKFKTEPIDPSDPFRGKYIILQFEADVMFLEDSAPFQAGQKIFVTFDDDSSGYAVPDGIYESEPETEHYLRTQVDYVSNFRGNYRVQFDLPFDRFYLEESKAAMAEQLYREAQRDTTQVAYALVSIGLGQAVIKDVVINDQPILNLVNQQTTNENP
jgi:uncharacterized membrane-anchored protein